jgi:hypothetical protein
MSWAQTGADVGTMVTGLSALTAAVLWTRNQVGGWKAARDARRQRNWHGYIILEGLDTWYVRLINQSEAPAERVVLDVVNPDGTPNPQMAHGMRIRVQGDGMLSRSPTPAEFDFLRDMRKERGYGLGNWPVT